MKLSLKYCGLFGHWARVPMAAAGSRARIHAPHSVLRTQPRTVHSLNHECKNIAIPWTRAWETMAAEPSFNCERTYTHPTASSAPGHNCMCAQLFGIAKLTICMSSLIATVGGDVSRCVAIRRAYSADIFMSGNISGILGQSRYAALARCEILDSRSSRSYPSNMLDHPCCVYNACKQSVWAV
jgi:hypothetical protein